jgi:hypothetical protein
MSRDFRRRLAAALAALALALPAQALAGTTWTTLSNVTAKAVDTTGTGSAPTLATDGFNLAPLGRSNGFTVAYESTTGSAFTACTMAVYIYVPNAASGVGLWMRANDLDLPVLAQTSQVFAGFRVFVPRGRIAFVPLGCGQAGIVWILGTAESF